MTSLDRIPAGVGATAFLVNESRARRPGLSHDVLARSWPPPSLRDEVRSTWEDFATRVYPHDDLVVSVRGRLVLDGLRGLLAEQPDLTLVNVGAGFTSYPWLLPLRRVVEIDGPDVVAVKRERIARLTADGTLPPRHVVHETLDLARPDVADTVRDVIARHVPESSPVVVLVEGVVFYLPLEALTGLLHVAARPGRPVAGGWVTYWPSSAADNPVLGAQATWFGERAVPTEPTFVDAATVLDVLGPGTRLLDTAAQQRTLGLVPVPEAELVPEHMAVLAPSS